MNRYHAVCGLVSRLVTGHADRALIFSGHPGAGKSTVLCRLVEEPSDSYVPFYFGGVEPGSRKEALDFAFNLVADRCSGATRRLLLFDEYDLEADLQHIDRACSDKDTAVVMSNIGDVFRYMPPRFISEPFPSLDRDELGELLEQLVIDADIGSNVLSDIADVLLRESKSVMSRVLEILDRAGIPRRPHRSSVGTESAPLSSGVLSYRVGAWPRG